jgi:Mg-chelatase subunit ChlD
MGGVMVVTLATGCGDDGRAMTDTASASVTMTMTAPSTGASEASATEATGMTSEPTGGATQASDTTPTGGDTTGPGATTGEPTTGSTGDSESASATATDTDPPVDCLPPDALILLDRTLTMHKTVSGGTPVDAPEYQSSKWYQAIAAIESFTKPPLDGTLRFGLELWPRDPGGGQCVTLAERVTNTKMATNPMCEPGEVVIEPATGNGDAIADLLDPATTLLCSTTPTGQALLDAGTYLAGIKEDKRDQHAILVTDGADWDFSCPEPSPLIAVQDLAKQGVKTHIVGFNGEEAQLGAIGFLNDLACAGQTAKGFPGPCVEGPDGWTALPGGKTPVYLQADDAEQLGTALTAVAGQLCCGCEKTCDPPEVLFALDRTLTMHKTIDGATPADAPNYASSKWAQAITAIEGIAESGLENDLRLGLELWPKDPGGGQCITLTERILDSKQATNPQCQEGEVLVPPALAAGDAIAAAIDPLTTNICISTPTGAGLITASDWLIDNVVPGRKQYVVLVTDGADWDFSCPDPSPLLTTQQIAAAGIQTYVVGFFGQEAQAGALAFLNDMACAGQTAKDFANNCVQMGGGYVAADPGGQVPLYLQAGANELPATFQGIADEILQFCVPG